LFALPDKVSVEIFDSAYDSENVDIVAAATGFTAIAFAMVWVIWIAASDATWCATIWTWDHQDAPNDGLISDRGLSSWLSSWMQLHDLIFRRHRDLDLKGSSRL
jgi:hypothetical protein